LFWVFERVFERRSHVIMQLQRVSHQVIDRNNTFFFRNPWWPRPAFYTIIIIIITIIFGISAVTDIRIMYVSILYVDICRYM
jgi:hypothetical protein